MDDTITIRKHGVPSYVSLWTGNKERIRLDENGEFTFFNIHPTDAAILFINSIEEITGVKVRIEK